MNTDKYIINKLLSNSHVNDLMESMKLQGHTCYVAGGAMTAIATGKHDEIADYDIYFTDVHSAVAAIRHMKEINPHVSFISDKSITYVLGMTTKIQFIYYAFYPTAEDIFKHFDFTINMMAYNNTDGKLYAHDNFWMHNAQRYLHINKDTFYPIISNLRVSKYLDKGYHTSRNEMVKLSLAISNLKIDSWEDAKAQMGNSYGYTLADFKKLEGTEFSIGKLFTLLETYRENSPLTEQDQYLYPIDAVDFVLLNQPIEVMVINDKEYYVDDYAEDCMGLDSLLDSGKLQKVVVEKEGLFSGKFYTLSDSDYTLNTQQKLSGWNAQRVYTKDKLPCNSTYEYVYEVTVEECNVSHYSESYLQLDAFTPVSLVCRGGDVYKFKQGEPVEYRENAKMLYPQSTSLKGWAYSDNEDERQKCIANIKDKRLEHLKKHIVISNKNPRYAHCTWSGVVVKGGEDITAEEIMLYMDDFNTCFGASISLSANGVFSGSHNTD